LIIDSGFIYLAKAEDEYSLGHQSSKYWPPRVHQICLAAIATRFKVSRRYRSWNL